ncbi:hypothetical protein GCM10010297_37780 [Streptomyces malachitofuscus]|nr:hypothetical protein GCM10010297_37780 [Streptomyces malachitofuscus]
MGVHPAHLADGVTEHRPAREVTVVTPWLRVMGAAVVLGAGAAVLPCGPAAGASGTAVAAAYGASKVGGEPASRSPSAPSAPSSSSSSSARPSSSPSGQPSRAGNRPGEGRERPGRPEWAEESRDAGPRGREQRGEARDEGAGADGRADRPDGPRPGSEEAVSRAPVDDTPASQEAVPVPSATSPTAAPNTVASTEPVLRILPLGSGLVLIGLGFGLAFVALRMRQASG